MGMFHMKRSSPDPVTTLGRWMAENRYSDPAFAREINARLTKRGLASISHRSVQNWRKGLAVPQAVVAEVIDEITGSAITASIMSSDSHSVQARRA
jgi:hypothetical protein